MIDIREKVPDVEFQAFHNGKIRKMRLSDFRGKWVVIFFYPGDFTFVCPTELRELAEMYDEFKKNNAEIISFSTDSPYVHKAWHETSPSINKVKFPMGSDQNGNISRIFGTYVEEEGVSLRGTFIVDPDGILVAMEIHDESIGRSAKEILRKLKAAKYVREHPGEVCPADWEPGKETIKPSINLVGKI